MAEWERVDKPGDFSNIKVFKQEGTEKPIYAIQFSNNEPSTSRVPLLLIVTSFVIFFSAYYVAGTENASSMLFALMFFGGIGLFVGTVIWAMRDHFYLRQIFLDFENDEFRVKKEETVTCTRPLSTLHNLSVEDHPDLEVEKANRAKNAQKGVGRLEKQHALVGWFGAGGSQREDLMVRKEWPKRYSLQEVAAAVNWAINHAQGGATQRLGFDTGEIQVSDDGTEISLGNLKIRGGGSGEQTPKKGRGIKPPLD